MILPIYNPLLESRSSLDAEASYGYCFVSLTQARICAYYILSSGMVWILRLGMHAVREFAPTPSFPRLMTSGTWRRLANTNSWDRARQ